MGQGRGFAGGPTLGALPANVTGEEIDAGNDSDEARVEAIEVPVSQLDVWDFLDEMGVFDF